MDKKIEYYLERNGIHGLFKSPAIMAQQGNHAWPILYLHKPKNVTQDDFDRLLKHIQFWLPRGFGVRMEGNDGQQG